MTEEENRDMVTMFVVGLHLSLVALLEPNGGGLAVEPAEQWWIKDSLRSSFLCPEQN